MFSTSGHHLLSDDARDTLKNELLPLADVITPNIFEAEGISRLKINNKEDMILAVKEISKTLNCHILIKGGHLLDSADDLLYFKGDVIWFNGDRINNPNNHGTGCTLSSAIACNLGDGLSMEESIKNAKDYITRALKANLDLGSGSGPLNHCI
jgi:hydroxymethylpyrimidine/phosphomethylpyrimidine kinase